MHPLCHICVEILVTYCCLWMWGERPKIYAHYNCGNCEPSLAFLTVICLLPKHFQPYCAFEKISGRFKELKLTQEWMSSPYSANSSNFLEKGCYVFGSDLGEIHAALCLYWLLAATEELHLKVRFEKLSSLSSCNLSFTYLHKFIHQGSGKGDSRIAQILTECFENKKLCSRRNQHEVMSTILKCVILQARRNWNSICWRERKVWRN